MTKRFRNRLSYRLTRDTVLVAMALGLVLNIIQISLDYFSARKAMEEDVKALIQISISPASQIAYDINIRLAGELLDGLLHHPATVDARIVDQDGQVMAAAHRSSDDSPYRWASDLLFGSSQEFSHKLSVAELDNLPLGQLVITIDTYHYGLQFLERASYTLFSGLIKSLILSAALFAIFYFVLTRPMLNVINALGEVQANSPGTVRLPVPDNHRKDEIGVMVDIINQHLETVDSSLIQLRNAESAMKYYSTQLEREVDDRIREISEKNDALQRGNRALIKAKEDAVRRARARANFLASMSHEIRTPLNGLLGMLGLALEGNLEPTQRNRLEIALNAGESLLGLLNDILDIAKVEAGKLNLETIPFSVRNVIEECATLHSQQARRKGIDLVTDIDPMLPDNFLGDPTRARQIVNNLLSNAIKFTDQGSVHVRATHFGGSLHLDVVDTGIGMSSSGLHKIFSPFAQADSDTTRLYGGTGLGLTLCRQLVERMHGQILVESSEGQGTHFTVFLPLPIHEPGDSGQLPDMACRLREIGVSLSVPADNPHRQPLEAQLRAWKIPLVDARESSGSVLLMLVTTGDADIVAVADGWKGPGVVLASAQGTVPPGCGHHQILSLPLRRDELYHCLCRATGILQPEVASEHDRHQEPPPRTAPLKILLVEDNQVNQLVATSLLKKLGHQVSQADNGRKALEQLATNHYDMVLMDCQMPVMDGYEATRRIRQNPAWKDLPVIAMTANVMQGDRQDCIASGMNDYITKPYNRSELRAVISRWAPPLEDS